MGGGYLVKIWNSLPKKNPTNKFEIYYHCKQFLLVHLWTTLTKWRLAAASVSFSLMEFSVSGRNLSHDNNYDFFIVGLQRSMAFHGPPTLAHGKFVMGCLLKKLQCCPKEIENIC